MPERNVVAIGASAGGVEAITRIAAGLPDRLPACVLIVLHLPPTLDSMLPQLVQRAGPLPARHPEDGDPVEPGQIVIAPPDRHLLVLDGRLRVVGGPRQNRARPAIDPLFFSAAVAYRSRLIGVVLTGALDDGAAGLSAVKRCGGVAVVQSPDCASIPDMPRHALKRVQADHVVPLAEMAGLIERLVHEPAGEPPPVPPDLLTEMSVGHGTTVTCRLSSKETSRRAAPPRPGGPASS